MLVQLGSRAIGQRSGTFAGCLGQFRCPLTSHERELFGAGTRGVGYLGPVFACQLSPFAGSFHRCVGEFSATLGPDGQTVPDLLGERTVGERVTAGGHTGYRGGDAWPGRAARHRGRARPATVCPRYRRRR